MKKILFIFAAAAMFLFAQSLHAQTPDPSPVVLNKYATGPNSDGTYTLTLKSYVTGTLTEKTAPADIIFVMDLSGSMKDPVGKDNTYTEKTKPMAGSVKAIKETTKAMTATTKEKFTATSKPGTVAKKAMSATNRTSSSTKNWSFSGVTANADGTKDYSHFYKDANGDYYVVHKSKTLSNTSTGASNVRALWYVDKNGDTWYLTSTGVSSTYEIITSDSATIWNGTLYKGWCYHYHRTSNSNNGYDYQCYGFDNGNADATVASQWYYLHTDGEYYPVRLANNLPDGNGNNDVYAAWVVIDGDTWYLHGDKLDTTYDKTMKSQYRAIWFAPLYKGGWTYSTMIAFNADGAHYYEYTDGKRYPVQKATETVDGVTTYQAFVEIPGVGKRYLYGTNRLSETPCPFATANNIPYYFGELYTGGWKTGDITDGTTGTKHYYLHTDGDYYPVRKSTASNNHQVYVDLPEGTFYFDGNGLVATSDTPYPLSPTNKYVTFYFGSLYTVTGWSYAGVTAATAGAGHYYKHTDDYYYPVLKEDLGASAGSTRYQLYVEVPEGKMYLWGHSLHTEVCPYSVGTATVLWYGTLYTGGWAYNSITVNASDKQGYSYLHSDGEYYPIFQETVAVNGTNTYQDYVILPDGNKWYLCGNEVSRDPYPYAVKNTVNNWFGPLYSGGWTYANITAGTAENGCFYLHTDGEYYPVLKEDLGASAGSSRYQAYVQVPEGKRYLYGTHLSETPYPFTARTNVGLYYGTLYTGGWSSSAITAGSASGGHYYLHTDGEYYPVKKETLSSPTRYEVYVELPDLGKMYLHGSSISAEPYESSIAAKATLYFGSLYLLKQFDYTKYVGMNRAVAETIEYMASKAQADNVNHRISLVQYGDAAFKISSGIAHPHLQAYTNSAAGGKTVVLEDFKDLSDPDQVDELLAVLPTERGASPTTGYTREGWGLSLARGLFMREAGATSGSDFNNNGTVNDYELPVITGEDHTKYNDRPKFVIVIGDGEDNDTSGASAPSGYSYSGYSGRYKEPKFWADQLKASVENLKVYVVHVSKKNDSGVIAFENYVSSNHNKPADDPTEYRYAVDYFDEALTDVLKAITGEIGGASIDLGAEATVRDVVRSDFTVPTGVHVSLYTSDCIGEDAGGLVFKPEEEWDAFDGTITRIDNSDGTTTIKVTGFDFSENWCGNHGTEIGYTGKQLIIQFPILPKDDLVGGMIPTNTPDSQILDGDDKPIKPYPIPEVGPFPIHLQIEKSGLKPNDSAVFLIYRKAKDAAAFDTNGPALLRVVLTGSEDGTPVIANINDLDPDYDYLIVESGWSWKYTPDKTSISTLQQTENPFQFGNTPKTGTPKSAEAKAENLFF